MNEKRIPMDKPLKDIHNGKDIYIYHETFEATPYLIVSYREDGKRKFKLNKSEL